VKTRSFFTLTPDWVCEVLSPSTTRTDHLRKLPIYAAAGVPFAWLVDPADRIVEAPELRDGTWAMAGVHSDADVVHLAPFASVAIELWRLWGDSSPAGGESSGEEQLPTASRHATKGMERSPAFSPGESDLRRQADAR
jgi:hypothetical protein